MSSLKLDRNLEEKKLEELKTSLTEEQKRQKVWLILTIITAVLLVIGILVMVFTSLNSPLIAIICFSLFIASFMLYAYSRQNIAQLHELIAEKSKEA